MQGRNPAKILLDSQSFTVGRRIGKVKADFSYFGVYFDWTILVWQVDGGQKGEQES